MDTGPDAAAPIRVVVVDDHPMVRRGLAALLRTLDGVAVAGEAGTGLDAVKEVTLTRPDVVIMDLRLPDLDGVAATRQIVRNHPGVGVLVLTMFDDDAMVADALAAGARGYLLKRADADEIERAVRAVANGDVIFTQAIARRVLAGMSTQREPSALAGLSPREREVLDAIATGANNTVIADSLHLAPKTVGNHISSIFAKLGVATRSEAIVVAKDAGLGRHR